jgi:hypothetical protein
MKITKKQIEAATLRLEAGHRGGGVEIDLTGFGFEGERMSAYQNYLGGGMLGAIQTNDTIRRQTRKAKSEADAQKLDVIADALARYFHGLTNHEDDEWESATFERNQLRPTSAY